MYINTLSFSVCQYASKIINDTTKVTVGCDWAHDFCGIR